MSEGFVIDDRSGGGMDAALGTRWRLMTDGVMGGVSQGGLTTEVYQGRSCLRLQGDVSTQNNGGFIQMTLDLSNSGFFDASAYTGVAIEVAGNGQEYNLHLRTTGLMFPWQSYRASFQTTAQWQRIEIPFSSLAAYRTERTFQAGRLKRIGLVAIGREFEVDLRLADIRMYSASGEGKS